MPGGRQGPRAQPQAPGQTDPPVGGPAWGPSGVGCERRPPGRRPLTKRLLRGAPVGPRRGCPRPRAARFARAAPWQRASPSRGWGGRGGRVLRGSAWARARGGAPRAGAVWPSGRLSAWNAALGSPPGAQPPPPPPGRGGGSRLPGPPSCRGGAWRCSVGPTLRPTASLVWPEPAEVQLSCQLTKQQSSRRTGVPPFSF